MAKKNSLGTVVFVVALVGLSMLYIGQNKDGMTLNLITNNNNELPPAQQSCRDYNLYDEYSRYLGANNMLLMRQACTNNGGLFTGQANEVSCHWPNRISLDCSQAPIQVITSFCTYLKATPTCSNITKYLGCDCNNAPPSTPLDGFPQDDSDDGQDSDGYTCAWQQSVATMGYCGGTCPTGTECSYIGAESCECLSQGGSYGGLGTVFVSSIKWTGAMGGLDGADAKCQQSAISAGLPGTWKAIMSDSTTSAISRLPDIQYYNMGGLILANNKADLFDGSIANFVNLDEYGANVGEDYVWTGTNEKGDALGDNTITCHEWSWVSDGYFGRIGSTGSTGIAWLANTIIDECKEGNRLYCTRVN